jgi:catechol 2,3-dioxygenase-like lactoylglutathione lyase family enzyme
MPIVLNHTIVPARDKVEAARFFADIFGLPYNGIEGPFAPIQLDNALTLDFDDGDSFEPHHYGFLVGDDQFDAILDRVRAAGVPHGAGPEAGYDGQINHLAGGRGVYFVDPNGHSYEIFTRI